jgi:hypothetical protein
MKEIEKKQAPDVSGGYRQGPDGGGCFPIGPLPVDPITDPLPVVDYPQRPIILPGDIQ